MLKTEWTTAQLEAAPKTSDPMGLIEARIEYKAAKGIYDPDGRYAVKTMNRSDVMKEKNIDKKDLEPGSMLRELHDLRAHVDQQDTRFQKHISDLSRSVAEIMKIVSKHNGLESSILEEMNAHIGPLEQEIKAIKRRVIELENRKTSKNDGLSQQLMSRFFAMFDREFPQYATEKEINELVERVKG